MAHSLWRGEMKAEGNVLSRADEQVGQKQSDEGQREVV
jgi:hypothetical protein